MTDTRIDAYLEAYPGSSVLYGSAMFDRRCRFCARYLKMPDEISIGEDSTAFDGDKATCSKCGPVKLVFEGFF